MVTRLREWGQHSRDPAPALLVRTPAPCDGEVAPRPGAGSHPSTLVRAVPMAARLVPVSSMTLSKPSIRWTCKRHSTYVTTQHSTADQHAKQISLFMAKDYS